MYMKNSRPRAFALIGAAGYIAPRHMQAIKDIGGDLRATFDPSDSVGVIDKYFPASEHFVEFEIFDRHIDKLRRKDQRIDYVSICSPNYLHDAHIRFALRADADAICEKPLVLNPWNIDALADIERQTQRKINTILQLRVHPSILALKEKIDQSNSHIHEVDLAYLTSRGRWYYVSWKGNVDKSGGIATNIGVHFFDMLSFLFGSLEANIVHHLDVDCAAGYLLYKKARVRWFLSLNRAHLPDHVAANQTTYRSITVDGKEIEFSDGFTDLHTLSYEAVVAGKGFGLDLVRPSIETVAHIRSAPIERYKGEQHPMLQRLLASRLRLVS
jgi:UDP-N-acetyl-2-amino-2-deoxyglucuronate dehydrogenase